MSVICKKCGTKNEDGSKFCMGCGSAFEEENVTLSTPQKKKSKKGFIIGLVLALLLLTVGCLVYFKDSIFPSQKEVVAEPVGTEEPEESTQPQETTVPEKKEETVKPEETSEPEETLIPTVVAVDPFTFICDNFPAAYESFINCSNTDDFSNLKNASNKHIQWMIDNHETPTPYEFTNTRIDIDKTSFNESEDANGNQLVDFYIHAYNDCLVKNTGETVPSEVTIRVNAVIEGNGDSWYIDEWHAENKYDLSGHDLITVK